MNKWQKAYLRGAYRGKSPGALYRERLGTVQDALDWIDDGDCLTWSTHGSEPKVFLEHLHTIAPRLEKGIDCWNHQPVRLPCDPGPGAGGALSPPYLFL